MTITPTIGYVPAAFFDEVSPPARPSPDDWITGQGPCHLADEDGDLPDAPLRDGEIVEFERLTDYGFHAVADADTTLVDLGLPDTIDSVWVQGDPDTLSDNLESLATLLEVPDEYPLTVGFAHWETVRFRFIAAPGGVPHFVAVDPAPAATSEAAH